MSEDRPEPAGRGEKSWTSQHYSDCSSPTWPPGGRTRQQTATQAPVLAPGRNLPSLPASVSTTSALHINPELQLTMTLSGLPRAESSPYLLF